MSKNFYLCSVDELNGKKETTHDGNATSAFLPPTQVEANATFSDRRVIAERTVNLIVRAKRFGRWWVLKALRPEYRKQSAYRLLLQKEYDLMSQLSHQNIVMVNSIEEVDGLGLCIVMEWIDGQDLSVWLADSHTKRQRLSVACQLLDALSYIHSRQTVHRDLKPSNIMIAANGGVVKLIDFGLGDADSYAIFKQPAGSDGYLSPEQCAGGKPDTRNDIYSFGCVLDDLRLGWTVKPVVRRCKQTIEKRYRNADEVRRALNRRRHTPYYILAFGLVLTLVLGYIAFGIVLTHIMGHGEQINTVQPISEEVRMSPQTELKEVTTTDTLPTKAEKRRTVHRPTDREIINTAIADGKSLVDKRIAKYDEEIRQRTDTLTNQRYIGAYLQAALTDINAFIGEYADSYKAKLSAEHAEQEINGQLLLYANERYYQPWIALLNDIPMR